jgi:hypothetical protein
VLDGAGAVVEEAVGAVVCEGPLAVGLGPNKLGAAVVPAGPEVPGAVVEGLPPPNPPKTPGAEVAGGAVVEGVLPPKPPNKPGAEVAGGAPLEGVLPPKLPKRLGVEVAGGAALEGVFPPRLPKRPVVEVAGGTVVLGAVVVGLLVVPPNTLGVDGGAEDVGGLFRPLKKEGAPVAGVVEPPAGFGVPKGLLAG